MPDILHLNNSKVKFHVTVVFKEQKIDCLIDQSLSIETIIKNICLELNKSDLRIKDLSLRNLEEELITDENFRRKVKEGDHLKLVASPAIEAADTVRNMKSFDEGTVKRTIFMLQKYIKEVEFVDEFINLGGLAYLQRTIMNCQGNTLAYALNSLQNLMEHDHGWENFTRDFVSMIVTIIVQQNLVNICRPATNIIVKLVCADKSSKGAVQCYGFDVVNNAITSKEFLPTLVQRLSATDYLLQFNSLHLINALFRHVTDKHRDKFVNELNALNIKETVMNLMISSPAEELTKQLVEFQRLTIQEGNIKKNIQYSSENETHKKMLEELWTLSGLTQEGDMKWRKLGFSSENPKRDLIRIGFYGLEILNKYANTETETYRNILKRELEHADGKSCPIMRASAEVIELLCDFWDINTGYTTTTSFQPFIFIIEKVFAITLESFIKLWHESEITQNSEDLLRVSLLVRSQFRFAITKSETCGIDALSFFKTDMLQTPYQVIKERHIKELELEDDLMSKVPIRHLRERLYKESYEFVKDQRINCLVQGAWFPIIKDRGRVREMFRYYRLSPNTKCLHYAEYLKIKDTRPPLEELIEKIDLSTNMDIMAGASLMVQHNKKNINPNLCFSLVGNRDSENLSHIDFICDSIVKYSEWIDGLNMFLDKNISSKSTAKYIQQLTDINLKLCLLELGSERVDIPVIPPEIPALPTDYQFFYEEGWCEAIDISDFEKNSSSREQSQENLFNISNANDVSEINEIELNISESKPKHDKKVFSPLTVNTKRTTHIKENTRTSYTTPFTPVMNIVQSVFDSNRYPNTNSVISNTATPLNYQDIIETPLPPMPPPLLMRSSSLKNSKQSINAILNEKNETKQSEEVNEMVDSDSIKNSSGPINGI